MFDEREMGALMLHARRLTMRLRPDAPFPNIGRLSLAWVSRLQGRHPNLSGHPLPALMPIRANLGLRLARPVGSSAIFSEAPRDAADAA